MNQRFSPAAGYIAAPAAAAAAAAQKIVLAVLNFFLWPFSVCSYFMHLFLLLPKKI